VLGATNAASAIGTLTTQLTTVSTGQSSLSASATGLTAKSKAVEALQNGLQNTVDTIQNIDATAMQARLQQLNNQQSIDYYLVSQMNTEAAAILSIFR
jgi:flagellin-like hook-associated protein FlgL